MTIPTISTLPTAPARTDPPATFISRADAFLAALVVMQGELNTSIGAMNTDIAQANTDAASAAASASAAALSATSAASIAGAALWVSGQSYAEGDAAISPINYQTYRAETATSGTTDPSLDANWTAISGTFPDQTGNSGKFLTTDGSDTSWDFVDVSSEITGTLPVSNGGTGATSLTANNVLLGNGTSAPLSVAPSTAGNVLTSNGTTWQSLALEGGGAWELISTTNASSASTIDIEGFSGYDQLKIIYQLSSSATFNELIAQFKIDGSYNSTSNYRSNVHLQYTASSSYLVTFNNATNGVRLHVNQDTLSGYLFCGEINIPRPNVSGYQVISGDLVTVANTSFGSRFAAIGNYNADSKVLQGIRLQTSSGLLSGEVYLYGLASTKV